MVLSILAGLVLLAVEASEMNEPIWEIPLVFLCGFVAVWLFYFFIKYAIVGFVVKGFKEKGKK